MKLTLLSIIVVYSTVLMAQIPKWVSEPDSFCSKISELCAVGEGTGMMMAEAAAKKNLASIFETAIKSTMKARTSATNRSGTLASGQVDSDYSAQIEESTSEVLNGVTIKERHKGSDSFFALASLNKKQASSLIQARLKTMDAEIKSLVEKDRRSSLAKAVKMLKTRDDINWRYEYLSGAPAPAPASLEKILARIRQLSKNQKTLYLKFNGAKEGEEIPSLIISLLLDLDYRVVTNSSQNVDSNIEVTINSEKRHLNVDGFEKYNFVIMLEAKNSSGKKLGALNYTTEQIGRSQTHAYASGVPEIKDYLLNHIDELNLD